MNVQRLTRSGILLALPYAWLARNIDKHHLLIIGFGTTVVSMSFFLFICLFAGPTSWPLDLIILFRLFECIGGGVPVAYVLLNGLLVAQTTDETRASIFYYNSMMLVLARAGGTALCGILLDHSPASVIPMAIAVYAVNIPVIAVSFSFCFQPKGSGGSQGESGADLLAGSDHSHENGDANEIDNEDDNDGVDSRTDMRSTSAALLPLASYKSLIGQAVVRWGLLFYVFKILATDTQFIQAQWIVRRFSWTFSAVAYANAYTALLCMVILAGLPFLSSYLICRYDGNTKTMELRILSISMACHAVGSLAIGLAPNRAAYIVAVSISALSVGSFDTFKSFLSSFCSPDCITELYATISLVETAVHIVASRMWAYILIKSFDLQGVAMGLPFLVSAGFSSIAFCLISFMARYKNSYHSLPTG